MIEQPWPEIRRRLACCGETIVVQAVDGMQLAVAEVARRVEEHKCPGDEDEPVQRAEKPRQPTHNANGTAYHVFSD